MNDPYKVLGVPLDASDDDIKKAYRNLARKYHPDNFAGTQMAELAEEKMKEINQAYESINKMRSAGQTANISENTYDVNTLTYGRIRHMINADKIDEANATLDYISPTARGAEWNFLKGCILVRRGWYYDAQKYFETACYLDPNNNEYIQAAESLKNVRSHRTNQKGQNKKNQENEDSICANCADKLCSGCCECFGGNSILCC